MNSDEFDSLVTKTEVMRGELAMTQTLLMSVLAVLPETQRAEAHATAARLREAAIARLLGSPAVQDAFLRGFESAARQLRLPA